MNALRLSVVVICLGLSACSRSAEPADIAPDIAPRTETGINPNIVVGKVKPEDKAALENWITEAVTLFKSPEYETNFKRAADIYPQVYVSKSQDIISTSLLLTRLKMQDPYLSALWWPKTYVILNGETATRSANRQGFGFDALRNAGAGPYPANVIGTPSGEIELGRLHFARFTRGDVVEKSCAMNTMIHEISHTLSDRRDIFWMHILDTEENVTPPEGVFEASYFIGIIAQCTYLEKEGRIDAEDFANCMTTFSDPSNNSRFRSVACDDFPGDTPITPNNRISP